MENKEISDAYSEVIEVLKIMEDDEKLEKLPMEFVELIKKKANPEYKPQISKDIPIENQGLKEETYSIIAWIAKKYWHEQIFETKKEEQKAVRVENDIDLDILEFLDKKSNLPILYNDLNWYQKIKVKIIKFIDAIFKRRKFNVQQDG